MTTGLCDHCRPLAATSRGQLANRMRNLSGGGYVHPCTHCGSTDWATTLIEREPDYPFTTDGCSGGIYRTIFRRDPPWLGCCVEHDELYWRGGTREERADADEDLAECVARRGHPIVAFAMWCGVRLGGHPLLPTPWRWGYGWRYPRGYSGA